MLKKPSVSFNGQPTLDVAVMANNKKHDEAIFHGLSALSATAFPKKCNNCGRVFNNLEEYVKATQALEPSKSGLNQTLPNGDESIVELYRNCSCGSTLMEFFGDRRDNSKNGIKRREIFGELLTLLMERGLDRETARAKLLKKLYNSSTSLSDLDLKNLK